jgi:hypothetical protein
LRLALIIPDLPSQEQNATTTGVIIQAAGSVVNATVQSIARSNAN